MALVISDTSPIRAMEHLALLDLLEKLYGQVYLPDAVAEELRRPSRRFGSFDPSKYSFLVIESPRDRSCVAALEQELDAGESAALALALERKADYVLLDERAGRRVARRLGLTVVGVLGILSEAKQRDFIPALAPLLQRLQTELDFRLAPQIVADVLRRAGE
jgi:hypothetical protein